MNILMLTSAMIDSHFAMYQERANVKPNPSNQNFYSKLIKCLAKRNNVAVVTLRPFVKGMFKEKTLDEENSTVDGVRYFYSRVQSGRLYKVFGCQNDVMRAAREAIASFQSNEFVIITDTIRLNLIRAANKLGEIYHVKVVGMLTDNPLNLSNILPSYATSLSKEVAKCDAFLSLTQKLVDNIDPDADSYVFDGLVMDEVPAKKGPISNYFFFAGHLAERYGVKALVDGFHNSNCRSKLIIAGTGSLQKHVDKVVANDSRILYLSQISKDKVIAYEKDAIANINPRPLNDSLDKESVPSKLIEYLSIGTPTISTKFPKIYKLFTNELTWIEDYSAPGIARALEEFERANIEEKKEKALIAKKKAFELYSLDSQSESITHFLNSIH